MFPFIFEWHWLPDRLIFMGLLYLALAIVGTGLGITLIITLKDLYLKKGHQTADSGH
jgi:hypothetical protein